MTNTAATFIPAHHIGDLVQVDPKATLKYVGIVFRVVDVPGGRRTKLRVEPIKGGQTVSGSPSLFISPDSPSWVGPREFEVPEVPVLALTLGSLVRMRSQGGLEFVVIKTGVDKFNVAQLGGDGGRFYRSVPRSQLTLIEDFTVSTD